MPVFTISYDLIKRKDYEPLWTELARIGAKKYLLSQWAVRRADSVTATSLLEHLRTFIDNDDRMFVARIDNTEWSSVNALIDLNTV